MAFLLDQKRFEIVAKDVPPVEPASLSRVCSEGHRQVFEPARQSCRGYLPWKICKFHLQIFLTGKYKTSEKIKDFFAYGKDGRASRVKMQGQQPGTPRTHGL
jgi:hypothetical protein